VSDESPPSAPPKKDTGLTAFLWGIGMGLAGAALWSELRPKPLPGTLRDAEENEALWVPNTEPNSAERNRWLERAYKLIDEENARQEAEQRKAKR
jgi:hypothetical protein